MIAPQPYDGSNRDSLTKRQKQILDFLYLRRRKFGTTPSVREIGEHFGINSPNGVVGHLKALQRKGFIERSEKMARAITLADSHLKKRSCGVVGFIREGKLYENDEDEAIPFLPLSFQIEVKDYLLLKITDDSFYHYRFLKEGDYLVLLVPDLIEPGSVLLMSDRQNHLAIADCVAEPGTAVPFWKLRCGFSINESDPALHVYAVVATLMSMRFQNSPLGKGLRL